MERKDYLNLQSKYSFLVDQQERYRKDLLEFIEDAFKKHGNEFEYKCNTHSTWAEKNEDGCFDAMNDLPVYLNIGIDDNYIHEIYPYRIRQTSTTYGYTSIEVDGWDWYDSDWISLEANSTVDDLTSIAAFINAVLEQESRKFRTFKQGERVAVCTNRGNYHAVVVHDANVEHEKDLIEVHVFRNEEDDDSSGISTGSIEASDVYQYANEKVCPRCGNPLFIEHHEETDYPYFCPWCDENFFNIEVE